MDEIDGLAFAAGAGRVAGIMAVSLKEMIVVVEDGGSLVLGGTGCRPSDRPHLVGEVPGHSRASIRMGGRANSSCWPSHT